MRSNAGSGRSYVVDSADFPVHMAWHVTPSPETIVTLPKFASLRYSDGFFRGSGTASFPSLLFCMILPGGRFVLEMFCC